MLDLIAAVLWKQSVRGGKHIRDSRDIQLANPGIHEDDKATIRCGRIHVRHAALYTPDRRRQTGNSPPSPQGKPGAGRLAEIVGSLAFTLLRLPLV
jgi:hypothetical protein